MYCLLLLALVASVSADSCPSVTTVHNFNFYSFAQGTWYEVARYPNPYENKADCGSAVYTHKDDVTYVTNRFVVNHNAVTVEGTVRLADNSTNSGIVIHALPYGAKGKLTDNTLYILEVEYNNYAIGYYCKNDKSTQSYQEYAWIFSRTKTLNAHSQNAVDKFVESSKLLEADKFFWPKFTNEACKVEE